MKSVYERFSKFFEFPTREGLREILEFNVGELDNLDFKESWPSYTKIAKHMLAFANSGGGCIIFGVKQTKEGDLETVGLECKKDKADIDKSISSYISNVLKYEMLDFTYDSAEYPKIIGKKFQVIFIEDNPQFIPYISRKNGEGIRENAIYIRKGTNSIEATYEELQKIFSRRIDTQYSLTSELELEEHLSQIKILYEQISPYVYKRKSKETGIANIFANIDKLINGEKEMVKNVNYPEETYQMFVNRMIALKKIKIEYVLDLK